MTTAYKAFIGGGWADAASGETMEVVAPATGETTAGVPRCGAEDVDRAVKAAKDALPAGSTRHRRSAPSSCTRSPTRSTPTPRSLFSSSR